MSFDNWITVTTKRGVSLMHDVRIDYVPLRLFLVSASPSGICHHDRCFWGEIPSVLISCLRTQGEKAQSGRHLTSADYRTRLFRRQVHLEFLNNGRKCYFDRYNRADQPLPMDGWFLPGSEVKIPSIDHRASSIDGNGRPQAQTYLTFCLHTFIFLVPDQRRWSVIVVDSRRTSLDNVCPSSQRTASSCSTWPASATQWSPSKPLTPR